MINGKVILDTATEEVLKEMASSMESTGGTVSALEEKVSTTIPDAPESDGAYVLTCTVADGVATYSWEAGGE